MNGHPSEPRAEVPSQGQALMVKVPKLNLQTGLLSVVTVLLGAVLGGGLHGNSKLDDVAVTTNRIDRKIEDLDGKVEKVDGKVERIRGEVTELRAKQEALAALDLEKRSRELEQLGAELRAKVAEHERELIELRKGK